MASVWSPETILDMARGYQSACVLAAGAELDLFALLDGQALSAVELAKRRGLDVRGLTILVDAMAGLGLLQKRRDLYSVPAAVARLLGPRGSHSVLEVVRHQANCMRRWTELPWIVRSGLPARPYPSIRGAAADQATFISAMHQLASGWANELISSLRGLHWRHLLDVGGGSGTWTNALLHLPATTEGNSHAGGNHAAGERTATIFDLPHVIPMARARMKELGIGERVRLVAGDFYKEPLPDGADLVWISAIIHQNSRQQNRELFAKVRRALVPGGHVVIRDVVVESTRTRPVAGALFAINMLTATPNGGTYTFGELKGDLVAAGLNQVKVLRQGQGMDTLVYAARPRNAR